MITTPKERCAFMFSHTYLPNHRKVMIKKSAGSPNKLLDKLNLRSDIPGKWCIEYILFDVNFTKTQLANLLQIQGVTCDNNCYNIAKVSMISYLSYLQQLDVEHSTYNEPTAQDYDKNMSIYGISKLGCEARFCPIKVS